MNGTSLVLSFSVAHISSPLRTGLSVVLAVLFFAPAQAQELDPRFGFGIELMINPADESLSDDALGLGFRFRSSVPMNDDVSLAAGLGIASFLLSGEENAEYLMNPQLSAILTLPREGWSPYILVGLGGWFPFSERDEAEGAFALHAGYGLAKRLSDTSVFVEANPNLIVRPASTLLILPLRIGIIF